MYIHVFFAERMFLETGLYFSLKSAKSLRNDTPEELCKFHANYIYNSSLSRNPHQSILTILRATKTRLVHGKCLHQSNRASKQNKTHGKMHKKCSPVRIIAESVEVRVGGRRSSVWVIKIGIPGTRNKQWSKINTQTTPVLLVDNISKTVKCDHAYLNQANYKSAQRLYNGEVWVSVNVPSSQEAGQLSPLKLNPC